MAIEVTSIADPRRTLSLPKLWRSFHIVDHNQLSNRRLLLQSVCAVFVIVLIFGGDALLGSYRYYAQIIDARLASGYLTSRPGLYAAPRSIRAGQKLSPEQLVHALRRAGYVESAASDVWSGSFYQQPSAIEIRPSHTIKKQPGVVRIGFDGDKISDLSGDELTLESFTLEP